MDFSIASWGGGGTPPLSKDCKVFGGWGLGLDFGLASWAVDGRRCFLWEVFVKCDDDKMMSLLSGGWGGEADFSTPLRFGRNDVVCCGPLHVRPFTRWLRLGGV